MSPPPLMHKVDAGLIRLKSVTAARERYVSAWLAIFGFDLLATLPQERRFIWKQKWSLIKVLYLLIRYVALLHGVFSAVMIFASVSSSTCEKGWWFEVVGGLLIVYFSALILTVRVYAIYNRNRSVLCLLVVLLAGQGTLFVYCATLVKAFQFPPVVASFIDFHGCLASYRRAVDDKMGGAVFTAPLIFDSVILILTIRRSVGMTRGGARRFPFINRVVSTGALYFSVITASNLVNVVMFSLPSTSPSLKTFHLAGSEALTSIASCRLVLSLFTLPPGAVEDGLDLELDATLASPPRIARSDAKGTDGDPEIVFDVVRAKSPFGDMLRPEGANEEEQHRGIKIERETVVSVSGQL